MICLLVGALCALSGRSQAVLSGILNQYTAVESIDACRHGVIVSSATGFQVGGQVILIQMQGATISTDNSSAFGDITSLASAGLYEQLVIRSIEGNLITFEHELLNTYQLSGGVQLVSMPVFEEAVVRGEVQAKPWDGVTGGVIALDVRGTLNLEANIDASGAGFRGGQANIQADSECNLFTSIRDYSRPLGNWRTGAKGEGIAPWVSGAEAGRGAQANGGGGGNDHNSGGGGGANVATGGRGGRNAEPSLGGCKGNFPGEGGKAITADTARLFMGGGGGAGDENNDVGTSGGAGGGIIILSVGQLMGNDFALRANGANAENTSGDGAGGGGAGGTIVVQGGVLTGNLFIEAKGGKGGDIDNRGQDRCHGPGGGGGGGRYLGPAGWNPVEDLSGGGAGVSFNSSAGGCGASDNLALPGEAGLQQNKSRLQKSETPVIAPEIVNIPASQSVCGGAALSLPVEVQGENLQFQWQMLTGNEYANLGEGTPYSGVFTSTLQINPVPADVLQRVYRLQVTTGCGDLFRSGPIDVTVDALPVADFSLVQNEFTIELTNLSGGADRYAWYFGDGSNSAEVDPIHTFQGNGDYEVILVAGNDCGMDTSRQVLTIEVGMAPSAAFSFSSLRGCGPLEVQFTNQSQGDYTEVLWRFMGGEPDMSTEENPVVTFTESGVYNFALYVGGPLGQDLLVREETIEVIGTPAADFDYSIEDRTVTFQNNSVGGGNFLWIFGDGGESDRASPAHTYPDLGSYEVTLITDNECGRDTLQKTLTIGQAPQALYTFKPTGGCAPARITFSNLSSGDFTSMEWSFPGGNPAFSNEFSPQITYFEPGVYSFSLSVDGPLGGDFIEVEDAVEILAVPEPSFAYETRGDTIFLQNNSTDARSYLWNFGDGMTSRDENPVHVYGEGGTFNVTLNASNAYCGKSTSEPVRVILTNTEEALRAAGISIYPNPVTNEMNIEARNPHVFPLKLVLVNSLGQRLERWEIFNSQPVVLEKFPAGIYYLLMKSATGAWAAEIIKQ